MSQPPNSTGVASLIRNEFARLWSSTAGIVATILLIIIPVLYTSVHLWGNFDPPKHSDKYPVAIVNQDDGFTREDGQRVTHGEQVAQNLVNKAVFKFEVADTERGKQLLESDTYAFVVTLPKSFSADLESASSDQPRQAAIQLTSNHANNALGVRLEHRLTDAVRDAVTAEIGDVAPLQMLDNLAQARDGITSALTNSTQLAERIYGLYEGLTQTGDEAAQVDLTSYQLATTAKQNQQRADQLTARLKQLDTENISQLPAQTNRVAEGARQASAANKELAQSVRRLDESVRNANAEQDKARQLVNDRLMERGVDPAVVAEVVGLLDPADQRMSQTVALAQQETNKANAYANSADELAATAQQINESATATAAAIAELSTQATQANEAGQKMAEAQEKLHTLAKQNAEKVGATRDTTGENLTAASALRDQLAGEQLAIPESTEQSRARQAEVLGDPIKVEERSVASAGTYGTSLAPYFVALSAWVGVFALFLISRPSAGRRAAAVADPVRSAFASWLAPTLFGIVQMVLTYLSLRFIVHIPITHQWQTLGLMVLAPAAFAALILALNVWLKSAGHFVVLLLLFIQLVGAGGASPWQSLPQPIRAIHNVMPMTWMTHGLEQSMRGGENVVFIRSCLWLALLLLASLAVAALGVAQRAKRASQGDVEFDDGAAAVGLHGATLVEDPTLADEPTEVVAAYAADESDDDFLDEALSADSEERTQ